MEPLTFYVLTMFSSDKKCLGENHPAAFVSRKQERDGQSKEDRAAGTENESQRKWEENNDEEGRKEGGSNKKGG